jgi:hypothetical protein
MGYLGAWGKLIREKTLKPKISRHCPFKLCIHAHNGATEVTSNTYIILEKNLRNYFLIKLELYFQIFSKHILVFDNPILDSNGRLADDGFPV